MTAVVDVRPSAGDRDGGSKSPALARVAPLRWRCRVLAHRALAEALLGDLSAASATAERVREVASHAAEPEGLAAAELALAWVCLQRADHRGAERHADAAAAVGPSESAAPVLGLVRTELRRLRDGLPAAPSSRGPALPLVDPLTARELEVLRRLDALLPTEEIASELCISVNTVKTHVRAILRKLSAERRYEAVRRAREIGLL